MISPPEVESDFAPLAINTVEMLGEQYRVLSEEVPLL
jgi:hypothetical protein